LLRRAFGILPRRTLDAAQHASRVELLHERQDSFRILKDEHTMDTAGAASPRDSGERRDHLDIFREFLA
jgi:hypothetical protein